MPRLNDQLQTAREQLQGGNIEGAALTVDAILQRAPRNPEALFIKGITRIAAGDAAGAVAPLEQALASDPDNGMVLDTAGLAYLTLGRYADAARVLRRAAALPGVPGIVVMRLGMALLHLNDFEGARRELQRAARLDPGNPDIQINLGQALYRAGDITLARAQFEAALQKTPAHADAMFNLGVIHLEQGDLPQAALWFERAVQAAPSHAEAWTNLGVTREREQNFDAATQCFQRALQIDPRALHAVIGTARVLALTGKHREARERFLAALALAPNDMDAHEGMALSCVALGRNGEALPHLRAVAAAEPGNTQIAQQLISVLMETGDLDQAEQLSRQLLTTAADFAPAYYNLSNILFLKGNIDEPLAILERGLERTNSGEILGLLTFQYRQICDWEKWRDAWQKLAPRVDSGEALGSPFWLLCEPITAMQQRHYTEAWARTRYGNTEKATAAALPAAPRVRDDGKLRIGYLSSDFQDHPAAYLIADVIEQHDRNHFEVFAYSYGPQDTSAMRQRLQHAFDHFVDIAWEPDDAAAARIRGDGIDILIEIKGYTAGDRITIMAHRPCDVQVTWLGYPGTLGAPFIDYLIADPYIIRPGEEQTCCERVLRMPHSYQPNDRKREVPEPRTRAEYGLPDRGIVFCCFNQTYKITPEVFDAWMRLLQRVPESVLWLVDSSARARDNLRACAMARGVAAERIVFAPRLPYVEHLARYKVADIALDTLPYTSHTTLSDALWCDCPVVGLSGDTFAARVSGSLLTAAELPDLITANLADYEALAYQLATDSGRLRALRERIALARQTAPQFDSERFVRDLEALYLGIAR